MELSNWIGPSIAETFDELVPQYFGPGDIDDLSPDESDLALSRLRADFERESHIKRRFLLWALLHLVDESPDFRSTFSDPAALEAALEFAEMCRFSFDEFDARLR